MTDLTTTRFRRVVTPGSFLPTWRKTPILTFVTIEYLFDRNQQWELSISGVEGPTRNGDAYGGCGQCRDLPIEIYADGWDADMVDRLRDIWKRWHLNGMRAGSPNQEEWMRANPYDRDRHGSDHYAWVTGALAQAGLNPDPNYARGVDGRPYSYGSAWLYEPVPAEVLQWLNDLPAAIRPHPWGDTDMEA